MGMRKASISLQDLREKIYQKAKAEPEWRFWGMYTHICKIETLERAYDLAKKNNGAAGVDGVTFEEIEEAGRERYLLEILQSLLKGDYLPQAYREVSIPKTNGKKRVLKIPTIRDRIVQGALKLILEPIFEADFQDGNYGYRPGRKAHDAIAVVDKALYGGKLEVIDLDLTAFFDNIRHDILLAKVAERVQDEEVLHLIKLICKTAGKRGVPQGGVLSPLLANIYLNEVDKMLEKAKAATGEVAYARYADDLVVLVTPGEWLEKVNRRLLEELARVEVTVNEEKSQIVNMEKGKSFIFLGFEFRRIKGKNGKYRPDYKPNRKARKALLEKLRLLFRAYQSRPIEGLVKKANPILRGWLNYFRIGNASRDFGYIRDWVECKLRRHEMKARQRKGYGWKRWSREEIVGKSGIYDDYKIRYYRPKALTG